MKTWSIEMAKKYWFAILSFSRCTQLGADRAQGESAAGWFEDKEYNAAAVSRGCSHDTDSSVMDTLFPTTGTLPVLKDLLVLQNNNNNNNNC